MQKHALGHIDCPYCAAPKMMRITHDKNGKPFGHCEDCTGQLRVGGHSYREKKFIERYPFSGQKAPEMPVTVTEPKPVEKPAAVALVAPVSVPEAPKEQTRKKASFADALDFLGGRA